MKTIQSNLEMRTAFQAISLKINVLQANRASICGKSWAFTDYPQWKRRMEPRPKIANRKSKIQNLNEPMA
jgi:hypothetical protein